ncbi:MAG: glutathione peroxidase [Ilumatobacteraceae bacterium]|jgi:glutathione peroxidase
MSDLYDLSVTSITGDTVQLSDYAGKVVLVVNVASACGLTPQYAGIKTLFDDNKEQGFAVLAFPCNQFGAQEPGTDAEILDFATCTYDATFPMFSKLEVNGPGESELYTWLKAQAGDGADISWNFEKFLIDREGNVVERFGPMTTPEQIAPRVAELL